MNNKTWLFFLPFRKCVLFRHACLILVLFISVNSFAQQTEVKYLSGTGSDNTVNWEFFCTAGQNSGKWTTIAVPSNWELQGFGKYDYGFAKDSIRGKEKGLYKYSFAIPSSWQKKKINIVFEGSMTDTEVKINGKSAGDMHQGSYYVFRYDISRLLNYGSSNLLEVTVAKHSANASVNAAERKADFWLFGGIFRPVFLEALPAEHIERVAVNATANGKFNADIYLGDIRKASLVSAQLFTSDGNKSGILVTKKLLPGDTVVHLQEMITTPKLWSTEFPNLYRVEFALFKNGKAVHEVSQKFGFRTIEVKRRDGIYVNGVKMKFKGVCRHSFWPTTGRALNKNKSIEDVLLIKDMNMNAVRMSHYPPDGHFLDVCDSLGLFVIDELSGWHGTYNTPTGTKLVKEMLDHDQNHPSIVFWANGNEGGHNVELDSLFDRDIQKRTVIHPWQLFNGIETQHYREYDYGIGNYMHGHEIVMPTEFLHGMYDGGHGAGLEDYWEAMWKDPLAAGGFLWDYADEGVVRSDKNGEVDTDGNHGPDGIIGPFHEKEGSYFAIKEIWSPIVFERKEITSQFNGTLRLENRFFFANTNKCSFTWKLSKVQTPYSTVPGKSVSGKCISPDINPLDKGNLTLSLPKNWQAYDILYVTAYDNFHREIYTWSWPIFSPLQFAQEMVHTNITGKVQVTESDSNYSITANNIELSINKQTGLLAQVKNKKGNIPFSNGPVLQEAVNNFKNFTKRYQQDTLIIESAFDRKNNYNTLQWTVYPSGWLKMVVKYFPGDYFTDFTGVNFSYPENNVTGVNYLGNGPYRVWKNRMKGVTLAVWNKAYNNTATGEQPIIYPEFKGYHSNCYWATLLTKDQPITIITPDEDVFLRLFTPKFSKDPYNTTALFPAGDISFMQGISPIGTKTQKPETMGPMGQKNIYYDYEKDPSRAKVLTVYFDFSGTDVK